MDVRIRAAIARVEIVQNSRPVSRGTGCLVAEGLVLTALHVVANRQQDPPVRYPGELFLHFPGHSTRAVLDGSNWDRQADWALLRCVRPPPVQPVPLVELRESGAVWITHGFPDAGPRDGMALGGTVRSHNGTLEGITVLQLFCEEAAAGKDIKVKGLSGAPVIVDGALAGLLRFALMEEQLSVAATLYACPIASVLEKCAGMLPAPRPGAAYSNAPPLPENFVDRPELLARLRDALFQESARRSIALTALEGMGGIGKTVLAQALCQDAAVRRAFPDGIFWFTIGREPRGFAQRIGTVDALKNWLGDYGTDDDRCRNQYRNALRDKAALLVLDDVWNAADIEPFRTESPRSRLLLTTRDAGIAPAFGAREFTAELLADAEARQVLARWAGLEPASLPPLARDIIDECKHLPLALAMIGAQLRGKPAKHWNIVLGHLRRADLARIKARFPEPHTSLFRAIEVSFEALREQDATAAHRYLALAVLLEDMPAATAIQQTLWNVDEAEAIETADRFVDLSLAQRDGDGSIRLHDLQLDYIRSQHPEPETLPLIHGAVRLSAHVLEKDPHQFASQAVGRLLPHWDVPAIQQFIHELARGAPAFWLRPLRPALHPPGTALLRTLEGHSQWITGVAVTPDGQRAVSASGDNTLKVWDLDSGRALLTLEGHSDRVTGVAVTPDGQRAVSASDDKTLKVWDLDSGRALLTLEGHSQWVNGVAVTPDGQRAVSASDDKTLKVWDLDSGRALLTLEGHSAPVNGVAVTPDGQRAVSASDDKTLKVWDLDSGRALLTLEGHSDSVTGVVVTPDGQRAVSSSYDNTLKVWDLDSGRALLTLEGHSDLVNGVAVTPDGQRAVSASYDHTLKVWDPDSGRALLTLEDHSDSVTGVAVTPDGQRAVSASGDKTLKVWDLDSGRALLTLEGHSDLVYGVAVTPDGQRAVSSSDDKTLKVWDLDSGRALLTLEGHSDLVYGVAVTPDGQRAVSSSDDKTLKVWDLDSGRALLTLEGHSDLVYGVAVTPDGQRAVSSSDDKTLKVWDLDSGRALLTLEGHSDLVYGVAVTPDGQRAVSSSDDKTLKVWDLDSGRALFTLEGHSSWVYGVAVTPDGQRAVSASGDNTLKVWELDSGRALLTLEGHSLWVSGVAVTPDGQRAVSASGDNTLKVWDLNSGRALLTLEGHSDSVRGVAVTPDGLRAVSASQDRTLKVWDLDSGLLIATFHCDGAARCCAFADNHRIVAAGAGGRVYILSLEE